MPYQPTRIVYGQSQQKDKETPEERAARLAAEAQQRTLDAARQSADSDRAFRAEQARLARDDQQASRQQNAAGAAMNTMMSNGYEVPSDVVDQALGRPASERASNRRSSISSTWGIDTSDQAQVRALNERINAEKKAAVARSGQTPGFSFAVGDKTYSFEGEDARVLEPGATVRPEVLARYQEGVAAQRAMNNANMANNPPKVRGLTDYQRAVYGGAKEATPMEQQTDAPGMARFGSSDPRMQGPAPLMVNPPAAPVQPSLTDQDKADLRRIIQSRNVMGGEFSDTTPETQALQLAASRANIAMMQGQKSIDEAERTLPPLPTGGATSVDGQAQAASAQRAHERLARLKERQAALVAANDQAQAALQPKLDVANQNTTAMISTEWGGDIPVTRIGDNNLQPIRQSNRAWDMQVRGTPNADVAAATGLPANMLPLQGYETADLTKPLPQAASERAANGNGLRLTPDAMAARDAKIESSRLANETMRYTLDKSKSDAARGADAARDAAVSKVMEIPDPKLGQSWTTGGEKGDYENTRNAVTKILSVTPAAYRKDVADAIAKQDWYGRIGWFIDRWRDPRWYEAPGGFGSGPYTELADILQSIRSTVEAARAGA